MKAKNGKPDPDGAKSKLPLSASQLSILLLALLTLAMFADVLFTTQSIVLSNQGTDLFHQFIHWRKFGFEELRQGNLALWNPHLFSGAPYFGGFQSALLYPPNLVYLILPLAKASNAGIALHVFLGGVFMQLWAANRGLHPLACFLSAVMFMFGGAHFMHIYAGHLPNLCTMVWAPLVFLAIDRIFTRPALGPCLLGVFAVAMQILAGHPQYVFYTAVAAGIYSALGLIRNGAGAPASRRLSTSEPPKPVTDRRSSLANQVKLGACLAAIYVGGAALCAVQLFTGLAESRETARSAGLSYEFAAMFSFPPENLLTLLAPTFFGNMKSLPYWGRCYLWEMSLFLSVTGLVLAIYGAVAGDRRTRRYSITMVVILIVLALGAHTPLFRLLYEFVPGFDKFRGNSKFIFLASLFLALLAGIGLDRLVKSRRVPLALALAPLAAGVLLGLAALILNGMSPTGGTDGMWGRMLQRIFETQESYVAQQTYADAGFQLRTVRHAANNLWIATGTLVVAAGLLFGTRRSPRLASALVALAALELFVFARRSLDRFDLAAADRPELRELLARQPGDYRILNLIGPNDAMSWGAQDLWGYDPGVLLRYAEFMAFTQGANPDGATQYVQFRRSHRLYSMLRGRYVFTQGQQGESRQLELTDPLPRLLLIQNCRVLSGRRDIFAAMGEDSFDPRAEVILESAPEPAPAPSAEPGTVKLVDASTDHLTIEADLSAPAILLVTDAYAKGWRARALPGSSQRNYQVMPANYCLRAIPLGAGRHQFVVEYKPGSFVIGRWISLFSLLVCLGLEVCRWRRNG